MPFGSRSHAFLVALQGLESTPNSKNTDSKRTGRCLAGKGKLFIPETLANGTKELPFFRLDPRSNPPQVPPSIQGILGNRSDSKLLGFQVGTPQSNSIPLLSTLALNGAINILVGRNRPRQYSIQAGF